MKKTPNIPSNALVILVGVSGSGKSTLAKKAFGEDSLIISSDEIREELSGDASNQSVNKETFDIFYKRIEEGMKAKRQVIADATNLDKFSRAILYEIAKRNNVPVYALVFNVPLSVIKRQNEQRERRVPDYAIERMFEKMKKAYEEIAKELPKENIIDIVANSKDKKTENER